MTSLPSLPSLPPEIIQELAVHGAPFTLYGRTTTAEEVYLLEEYLSRVFPTWRVDPFQTAAYLAQRNPDLLVSYLLLTGNVDRYGILASPAVFRGDLALLNRLLSRSPPDTVLLYYQLLALAAVPSALSVFRGLLSRIARYHPGHHTSFVHALVRRDNFEGLQALAKTAPVVFRVITMTSSLRQLRPHTLQRLLPLVEPDVGAQLANYDFDLLAYRIAVAAGIQPSTRHNGFQTIYLWRTIWEGYTSQEYAVTVFEIKQAMQARQLVEDRQRGSLGPPAALASRYGWLVAALYLLEVNPSYLATRPASEFEAKDPGGGILNCLVYGGWTALLSFYETNSRRYEELLCSMAYTNRVLFRKALASTTRPIVLYNQYYAICAELIMTESYDDLEAYLAAYSDHPPLEGDYEWTSAGLARFAGSCSRTAFRLAAQRGGETGDLELFRTAIDELHYQIVPASAPLLGWELYWTDISYHNLVNLNEDLPRTPAYQAARVWLERLIATKAPRLYG